MPTGKHYIRIAADVDRRLNEHNPKTGRWTSSYKPWELIAVEEYPDRAQASRRERLLKGRSGSSLRKELYGEGKIRSQ
jgi:predicted GIY-YIG superfamily endonuclease